ncbi:MAG: hypothetical protein M0Z66_08730 [Thermaerobacter sp.]|nr:hypothetical protein [Thermaerobacter sp.]
MRLHRSLPLAAITALLLAGCGSPSGPSTAENIALQTVAHGTKVLSYPIAADSLEGYLPSAERSGLGAPAYLFAIAARGKKPTWVVSGRSSAHALHVYKDIADIAAHASDFGLKSSSTALHPLAAAKVGTVPLPVIGFRVRHETSAQLKKGGIAVPIGDYTVVSVLSLPPSLHAPHAAVANFVESGGKVVDEFGTNQ